MLHFPHLASRIFGVPLAIERNKADEIVAAMRSTFEVGKHFAGVEPAVRRSSANVSGAISVIQVLGTTVKRAGGMDAMSGLTSYDEVRADIQAAIDAGVAGIILDMDTPGGEVSGMFEFADWLASIDQVPIYAVANDLAASAGYLVASATDKIFTTLTGRVGSIGIYAMHLDQSEADAKDGLKYSFVYSGDHKVDGNSHEPLVDRKRSEMQSQSDAMYKMFVSRVSNFRGLDQQRVIDTKADTFTGSDAVRAGLADEVGTLDDAIACMSDQIQSSRTTYSVSAKQVSAFAGKKEQTMDVETKPADTVAPNPPDIQSAVSKARDAGFKDAGQIVAACTIAGKPHLAQGYIEKGANIATVLRELQKAKAEDPENAAEVSGHAMPETTGMVKDAAAQSGSLLAACKKSAEREKTLLRAKLDMRRHAGDYVGAEVI